MTADPIGNPESSPLIKSVAQPSVALESASPSPTQIIDPVLLAATAQPPTSGPSVSPKTLLSQTDGSHFHTGAEFAHTANSTGLAGALSYLDELPHPPWKLATADLHIPVSQPPSSNAISPLTPGLGPHGLYHDQPFEQRGKTAHTGSSSYLGATVGNTSTPSSDDGDVARSLKQPTHWNKGEAAEVPPPKKKSHARKQPDGHIKRARNAFILFRKHVTDSNLIPPSVEIKHQNISMVAAKMWREAPQEVRQQFQEQARVEKEEHQRKYPGYRYQPVFRRTNIVRRRVRKDPLEDDKVDAVADALMKGKAGKELEQDIREQMVAKGDASESETDSNPGNHRQRNRAVGQLSKGALRAQKAQERERQIRQSLFGTNLLSMSMYNAATQRGDVPFHPGAQHHFQYCLGQGYAPLGYSVDGQPIALDQGFYSGQTAADYYRLPPIEGVEAGYAQQWPPPHLDQWTSSGRDDLNEYGNDQFQAQGEYYRDNAHLGYRNDSGLDVLESYRLPPLTASGHYRNEAQPNAPATPPRLPSWPHDGQQTPSGHVLFSDRLFDGALESAGLPRIGESGRDDELQGFAEASAEARFSSQW